MKGCVLEAVGQLIYKEVDAPIPKTGEVLLKTKAAGICGSDIERVFVKGTYHFPTIPGHEFSGKIVQVGEGVDTNLLGRRAAVFPLLPCRKCDMCEVGEYASCRNYNYFGSRCDGGFAEYVAIPVWNLIFGPDSLSYEVMAMAEPAAVSLHALSQGDVKLGDQVAVFGAGAIGLMIGELARIAGVDKVIMLDIEQKKLDFAKSIGFSCVVNTGEVGWKQKVMEYSEHKGVDLAIEGAGVSATIEGCFEVVKPLGRVVLMGNPIGDVILRQKAYWEILRKQLTVSGTWNSDYTRKRNDWQIVMEKMASGKLEVSKFITHRFKLRECNLAFEMVRDKKEFTNRVIFINND